MATPYEMFSNPLPGADKALVFPWPSGYSEREISACRDSLTSTALIRFTDGALLLAELPTFAAHGGLSEHTRVDWSTLEATPILKLSELLERKTWRFAEHCERRLVQMSTKQSAGWLTGRPRQDCPALGPYNSRLFQHLLGLVSALCMGSSPQVNSMVSRNRGWSPAAIPFLHRVAADEIGLRTRAQVLELAELFGLDLPMKEDGIRFDLTAAVFAHLQKPNENAQAIASGLGCSISAVQHALRHRYDWLAQLSGMPRRTQRSVVRGLDAIVSRSHWPREPEQLRHHIEVTQRALSVAAPGDVVKWQKWALSGAVNQEGVKSRLDEVSAVFVRLRCQLSEASDLKMLGPNTGVVVAEAIRGFGNLILQRSPKRLAETHRQIYNLASLGALEDTLAHIARLDSCAPWDLVEANLRTLQDWAAESPSTRLRIRVLRNKEVLEDWGIVTRNCVKAAGAAMQYVAQGRLLLAVEQSSSPFKPVATLAMATVQADRLNGEPRGSCRSIRELQLAPSLRALSDEPRAKLTEMVMLACAEIEASGQAIWLSNEARQWRERVSSFSARYQSTPPRHIGGYLPGAIRRVAEAAALNRSPGGRLGRACEVAAV